MPRVFSSSARPIQIALKNEHGSNFIDFFTPFSPIQAHFLQVFFGGETRQPLIPENDRDLGNLMQFSGEFSNLFTLRTGPSIHMKGLTYNNFMDLILLGEFPQQIKVGFELGT